MMLRGLLTCQPKEEASYSFEMPLSNAEKCNNYDDWKRDPDKIKKDPEMELHNLQKDNKNFEKTLTNISIKEEISFQEVALKKNEDIQVNSNEQFHIETVYIPMANEQTESQTNNIHKIKNEIDIDSYTADYENEAKNLVPEIKVSNVYEHVLEINPQINNIHDKINEKNLDIENHTTESYVVNKNEESKLLVPPIKVSNVYDHVLEINPFAYTNFKEQGRDTDSEYESGAPVSSEMKLSTEVGRKKRVRERLNKAPKTSAERGREFRARKALLRQQIRQQQELDAVLSTEDSQGPESSEMRRLEKKARHAEATRRWREKKRALKKKEKVKTPAERSREYRARKKALKNSNQESCSTSEIIQEMQENSLSENSQDSDSCPNINKRKTPADYSREYRARKKALKNYQKQSDSEDSSLNPVIKPKTPAERSRDYRARKKAYVDLEKPIPIALSIDMLKSKKSCTVDNFSILPDNINDISDGQNTSNCNNNMEGFQDSGTDLHDMLHHMHNYISNKLTEEILTDTEIKKEICDTEANENIQADCIEHVQIKTEYTQSPITDLEIEYQIEDKHNEIIVENKVDIEKGTDSVNENVESKLIAPEIGVNNIYDHVLEIKQEIPCEFINFDEDQNIDFVAVNNGTNLQEDFRIKCESESFKDT